LRNRKFYVKYSKKFSLLFLRKLISGCEDLSI
jgi:hypothetical protein